MLRGILAAAAVAAVVVTGVASAGSSAKSPRGPAALLTYTASPHADPEDGQYLACIARSNGTHRVRIVQGTLSAAAPAWNRSGTRVAFTGWNLPAEFSSADDADIVVSDSKGNLLRNLTAGFSRVNFNPKWSRDGKWIAFASDVLSLTVVPSDGSASPTVVDVPDFAGTYDWLPGGGLVVSTFDGIVTVNRDGSDLTPLYDTVSATDPAVSPNGKKILFAAGSDNLDVYVGNLQGAVHRLTKTRRNESSPAWSPDGKWIAYEQDNNPNPFSPRNRILLSRSNGTDAHTVIAARKYDAYYPNFRRGTKLPGPAHRSC